VNGTIVALLAALMLAVAAPLRAQEPAPPEEPQNAPQAAADEEPASPPEADSAPQAAEDEERPPPPPGDAPPIESRGGADDVFIPSEQVRADSSIAFPVDI
jgi:hypothetical protein